MKKLFLLFIPALLFSSDMCMQMQELTPNFLKYSTTKKEFEALKVFNKRLNICENQSKKCNKILNQADQEIETIISYFHTSDISKNIVKADIYMDLYSSCLKQQLK